MSVARWVIVAALLAALMASATLVVVRDHPAIEHTRAFRDEDKAARAVLRAVRTGTGSGLDEAHKLLAGKDAWLTAHNGARGTRTTHALADVIAGKFSLPPGDDVVLQVDVAIEAPRGVSLMGPFALGVDPGLDGLRLPSGEVEMPGVLLARGLSRGKLAAYALRENATLGVRTYAVVETKPADQPVDAKRLLLGALLPEPVVTDARLVRAAALGGTYLAVHTKRDGRFDYEIDASDGKVITGYNAVRHAGTTYAMLQLFRQQMLLGTPDDDVLESADRAIGWLTHKTVDDPTDPTRAFQIDGKKVKLGGGALTLMAFVERLHVERSDPARPAPADVEKKAAQLARYLVSQQDGEGRFASYYAPSAHFEADARDSIYYPGEAVLALARYAALETARGRDGSYWRAAAEKGARFLVDERHAALGVRVRMPVDAWLLLAIEVLDRSAQHSAGEGRTARGYANDDTLLQHADRIARQIMREQYVEESVPLPMKGARADTDFGSLVSTGSRMEALGAATALEMRHAPRESRVKRAAIANAAYGMRFQFDEERLFLTHPKARALGGVPNSVTDPRIRIDGVQHNMSGWLLLAAVLGGRELP